MHKFFGLLAACFLAATLAQSPRIIHEDFATDPAWRGWKTFGTNNLISWNAADGNLAVTWDSSFPNNYFRLPLQTILERDDDFVVSLDLFLNDITAGANPAKHGTFQIAFGFQNQADASRTNFVRAKPPASPNLLEFNFFPDTGFGPTVWPAIFATNGNMNYSGSSDFNIFDLPIGVWMQIELAFSATNQAATLRISTNDVLVGPVTTAPLATNDVSFGKAFTQFKLDAFAIASYSDAGYGGSLLAHGMIDNVTLTVPQPAIVEITATSEGISFQTQKNWTYTLEATADFLRWGPRAIAAGAGDRLTLQDTNPELLLFYRIRADRIEP